MQYIYSTALVWSHGFHQTLFQQQWELFSAVNKLFMD